MENDDKYSTQKNTMNKALGLDSQGKSKLYEAFGVSTKIAEMNKSMNKALGLDSQGKSKLYEAFGISSKIAEMNKSMNKALGLDSQGKSKLYEAFGVSTKIAEMNKSMNKALGLDSQGKSKLYEAFGVSTKIAEMNKSMNKVLGLDSQGKSKLYEAFGISSKIAEMNNVTNKALGIQGLQERSKLYEEVFGVSSKIAQMNDIANKALGLGISELFEKIDFGSVEVNEDGTVNYLDTTINFDSDINDTIDVFNTITDENDSVEKKIYNLFVKIKNKHPIIIGIIIVAIIAPFYQYYIDCGKSIIDSKVKEIQARYETQNDKNKLEKDMKKEISKEWYSNFTQDQNSKQMLNEYRFVTADCLNVRVNSSTDSRVVYKLKFGQVIRLLNKNRNWALIEYSDDESICLQGWVYTRYISEFK
ncbi:SH3 domain-containing protein [Clostridium saccharoperbutylacetonicum]